VFCDSQENHPNIDDTQIERLITSKTKAIVVVHYAGVACEMDNICSIATKHNLFLIEDAAQAIDSFYKGRPLGSFGHFAAFSFHETKNVISGEGGMLVINDLDFVERAEIIREKGTNRSKFFRGEIDKYGWVDIGSSYLPSDIIAAFLFAQLENLEIIQDKRLNLWNRYYHNLAKSHLVDEQFGIPVVFDYASNNAHMFYLKCKNLEQRNQLIDFLKSKDIHAVFHYLSLHKSEFFLKNNKLYELTNADEFTVTLVRLPLYFELEYAQVDFITNSILEFFINK
jgi:dTDP-4-amino-4,6-dideoxygalactose transaminase